MPDGDDTDLSSKPPTHATAVSVCSELRERTIESTDVVLEPPTQELAAYDPFVRWLLGATLDELTAINREIPFAQATAGEDGDDDDDSNGNDGVCDNNSDNSAAGDQSERATALPDFGSVCEAKFARAEVEGELEAVADRMSVARREFSGIDDTLADIEDERDESRERIALLESRIVKHLQDRDLAIAEKYTTEKQIEEAELFKAQHPQRQNSLSLLGLLRRHGSSNSNAGFSMKDIERLQKEVADVKVSAALAKSELDSHYYRLRQLERKCAGVKFEVAQASALEDDLRASIEQLAHERRHSLERLRQISVFSGDASTTVHRTTRS